MHAVDRARDHLRGAWTDESILVVGYQDFLCPYCRRLRPVLAELRKALGERIVYVFRHFPSERAHPGAELAARATEAAALQGRFFEMHDGIFDHDLPIGRTELTDLARRLDLDVERFARDLESEEVRARVERDVREGRENGVSGTPTLFVDSILYDGAWDYDSMLEGLERPVAARIRRTARAFASLPTSAGLVLLLTVLLAVVCANTPIAPLYERIMSASLEIGAAGHLVSMTAREWISEGLLALFFLIVGLEIRRELTVGALANWRAALLPIVAAMGGVVMPALIYLACNRGPTAGGWGVPTATDVAFALALLAILGTRVPVALRVFVATLAVVDDILSMLLLAILSPSAFAPAYGILVVACLLALAGLNRARVYAMWPYAFASLALWLSLHALGVHAALAGTLLALFVPTRPAPSPAPLLAQAANALAALDHAEKEARREKRDDATLENEPLWEWATRNLSAASARLLSPAERMERAVAPWSTYLVLPLFAFSATGIDLRVDLTSPDAQHIVVGAIAGLVLGKPLGILLASGVAIGLRAAVAPKGVSLRQFVGAACLCGVGDMLALLLADRALAPGLAAVAKLGVFAGSAVAAVVGLTILARPAALPEGAS
jgi:NhaA family Na+:H+ antiporter